VTSYELRYGKTNCSWASCREGCTAEIFKCHQVRVTYTPKRMYENNTMVQEIKENEWAYLTRTEKPVGIIKLFQFSNNNVVPE
jgi:hypothetical protein